MIHDKLKIICLCVWASMSRDLLYKRPSDMVEFIRNDLACASYNSTANTLFAWGKENHKTYFYCVYACMYCMCLIVCVLLFLYLYFIYLPICYYIYFVSRHTQHLAWYVDCCTNTHANTYILYAGSVNSNKSFVIIVCYLNGGQAYTFHCGYLYT